MCISSRGNDGAITLRDWHPVGVIEYGYVAPDPLRPRHRLRRRPQRSLEVTTGRPARSQNVTPDRRCADGKYRADRTQPIMFSPVDPHLLYYAANIVFKTTRRRTDAGRRSALTCARSAGIPASLGRSAAPDAKAEKQRGVVYALAPSFKTTRHAVGRHR